MKFYEFTIMKNDPKNTDRLEYKCTKNLREIYSDIESIRKYYMRMVDKQRGKY